MLTRHSLCSLALRLAASLCLAGCGSRLPKTGDPACIRASGNVEVTEVELSFRLPGRLEARLASEGEQVKAGQEVARLDRTELACDVALRQADLRAVEAALAELEAGSRAEEIAAAEAGLRKAQALLAELEAGSRAEERAAAEAGLAKAQVERELRLAELGRLSGLHGTGAATPEQFDAAKAAADGAAAAVQQAAAQAKLVAAGPRPEAIAQARAAGAQAQANLDLVRAGPRRERIDQARAQVERTRQLLALADTRLGYAVLTSPVEGVVLSESAEAGEWVNPGTPVVTVADLSRVWVRIYVHETDLGRVKLGQVVRVRTDSYPDKVYEGRVTFISSEAEFTPKTIQTPKERVRLVFRVKVDVGNPAGELKPGMPADAEIATDGTAAGAG